MRNYSKRIFHILIITFIGFILAGCGYKGAPQYEASLKSVVVETRL